MPTYDYACTACGRELEVMHGVHGHGPTHCEHCGGAMRKLLSAPTFHFKGSGWAKKDARDSAGGAPAAKASTTPSTTETSSEPKPEPKATTGEGGADKAATPAPSSPTPGA